MHDQPSPIQPWLQPEVVQEDFDASLWRDAQILLTYWRAVPIKKNSDGTLLIAFDHPDDIEQSAKMIAFVLGCPVVFCVLTPPVFLYFLNQFQDLIAHLDQTDLALSNLNHESSQPFVAQWLRLIFEYVYTHHISDIHFESSRAALQVRLRRHGVSVGTLNPPARIALYIHNYLRHQAQVNFTHIHQAQDGRLTYRLKTGQLLDFRFSSLPFHEGESIVLRVLNRHAHQLDLLNLGLDAHTLGVLKQWIQATHGLFLCTGSTGSGKTTTLYACLREILNKNVKLITLEDPIEYALEQATQIPVEPDFNFTYPQILKAILRHDPDVIAIGEIRDAQTAQLAFEAALTGHAVFATLHATDAQSTVKRLLDMGIDLHLIRYLLKGILSQRWPIAENPVRPIFEAHLPEI